MASEDTVAEASPMPAQPSSQTLQALRTAATQARSGDIAAALSTVTAALRDGRDVPVLSALAGTLACRSGDLSTGIDHLSTAHDHMPSDLVTRINLAQALIASARTEEAWALLAREHADADASARLWRLRGYVQQGKGDLAGAVESYLKTVAAMPDDFESWNNLGNAYSGLDEKGAALDALDRAARLRPDIPSIRLNHAAAAAESLGEAEALAYYESCTRDFPGDPRAWSEFGSLLGRLHRDEHALAALSRAALLAPDDAAVAVRLGEQCVAVFDIEGAEQQFVRALQIDPVNSDAHIQLAILLEQNNRVDDLRELARSAEATKVAEVAENFIRAMSLRREWDFRGALRAISSVPASIEPGRRSQLIAQCHDRLGNHAEAFEAFSEMNRLNATDPTDPKARARIFRSGLERDLERLDTDRISTATVLYPAPDGDPAPVFLVGFPRSGTTLLDTLLMGHPKVSVMEELPPLRIAEEELGDLGDPASWQATNLAAARARYFREVRARSDWETGRVLIDKLPMNMTKVPLIHRLFPDARFLLAIRHPCDAVLSCFMATFKLNNAMANFLELETTALTYDLCFRHWQRCRELMPIRVRTVRYEDVVRDRAAALRPVFDYLDLDWDAQALDNVSTAAKRRSIRTASYAQVTEPVYSRAVGRWTRYRSALEPVLPTLRPWITQFGYEL